MTWISDKVFPDADSFIEWLDKNFGDYITKHISEAHTHHTYIPNHSHNKKYPTLNLHKNMRSAHMNGNGWDDIAQNITIGMNGEIVTGRDIRWIPISAKNYNGTTNWHPFAYEMIGNFDKGNDVLAGKQLESSVKISRYFYNKMKTTKFHRELLLNGKQPKSCPGTGVDKDWFMNLVKTPPVKDGWKKENGKWFFYDKGNMVKNKWTFHTDKKWYYLESDGSMAENKWIRYNEKWFFVDEKGIMQTGWIKYKEKWYFLNKDGDMKIGWHEENGKKYYLSPKDGDMITGWISVEGKWSFFKPSGELAVNAEVEVSKVKVNSDGSISEIK